MKYQLVTLGCKVNQYESQRIREAIESLGLRPALPSQPPDLAVINTCAVTAEAMRKNRQAIRRLSRRGRTAVIVVGCGASADPRSLEHIDGVVAVLGHDTDVVSELRDGLSFGWRRSLSPGAMASSAMVETAGGHRNSFGNDKWMKPDQPRPARIHQTAVAVQTGRNDSSATLGAPSPSKGIISRCLPVVNSGATLIQRIESFSGHQRAFLKVQDGCDAHCSYCIIPRLRPTLRWKPIEVAVDEARRLVQAGHKEIVVTGIFLGAYGQDTAIRRRFSSGASSLSQLVRSLAAVEGLHRLRLSSLEPGDVDGSLLSVMADQPVCVPHLHLPLQAGSERVLRRMNRQYSRGQYLTMIDRVRSTLDRPAITTDIIVGFPGESDADFEDSLNVARDAEFCKIHAFPFSPRDRTAAARWKSEFVPPSMVRERMMRLAEVDAECSLRFRSRMLGCQERVIIERGRDGLTDFNVQLRHGRADRYFEVHFQADPGVRTGDVIPVHIERVTPTRTHASRVSPTVRDRSLFVLSNP